MVNTLRHFWFLLFDLKRLASEAERHMPKANADQLRKSLEVLQKQVFRAFKMAVVAMFWAMASAAVLSFLTKNFLGIHPSVFFLTLMKIAGYFFVLWGVLSPVGSKIQTWDGETFPEILEEEWHRACYMLGLLLLWLSYFLEL